jgi:hypothetical protein
MAKRGGRKAKRAVHFEDVGESQAGAASDELAGESQAGAASQESGATTGPSANQTFGASQPNNSQQSVMLSITPPKTKRQPRCSNCNEPGHNKTRCPLLNPGEPEEADDGKDKGTKTVAADLAGQAQGWSPLFAAMPEIVSEDGFTHGFGIDSRAREHALNIATRMNSELKTARKDLALPGVCPTGDTLQLRVFLMLHKEALLDAFSYMSMSMIAARLTPVSMPEFFVFLGQLINNGLSSFDEPTRSRMLSNHLRILVSDWNEGARESERWPVHGLLAPTRFQEALRHLRGFEPPGPTSASGHADRTDDSTRFRAQEQAFSKKVIQIVAMSTMHATFDDRQLGTLDKDNPVQSYKPRKTKPNGLSGDNVADSDNRISVASHVNNLAEGRFASVEHLMSRLPGISTYSMDRGFATGELWLLAAARNLKISSILGDSKLNGLNVLSSSAVQACREKAGKTLPADRQIADGPRLGQGSWGTKKKVAGTAQSRGSTMLGVIVREYGNAVNAKVLRFVFTGVSEIDVRKFVGTWVARQRRRLSAREAREVLFADVVRAGPGWADIASNGGRMTTRFERDEQRRVLAASELGDGLQWGTVRESDGMTFLSFNIVNVGVVDDWSVEVGTLTCGAVVAYPFEVSEQVLPIFGRLRAVARATHPAYRMQGYLGVACTLGGEVIKEARLCEVGGAWYDAASGVEDVLDPAEDRGIAIVVHFYKFTSANLEDDDDGCTETMKLQALRVLALHVRRVVSERRDRRERDRSDEVGSEHSSGASHGASHEVSREDEDEDKVEGEGESGQEHESGVGAITPSQPIPLRGESRRRGEQQRQGPQNLVVDDKDDDNDNDHDNDNDSDSYSDVGADDDASSADEACGHRDGDAQHDQLDGDAQYDQLDGAAGGQAWAGPGGVGPSPQKISGSNKRTQIVQAGRDGKHGRGGGAGAAAAEGSEEDLKSLEVELEKVSVAERFGPEEQDWSRATVTGFLFTSCFVYTLFQRTPCWFILRKFTVTGSVAAPLVRGDDDCDKLLYVDPAKDKKPMMSLRDAAVALWYGYVPAKRFKGKDGALLKGKRNETGLFQELRLQPYIQMALEVGLFASRACRWMAVSADGVVVLNPARLPEQRVGAGFITNELKWAGPPRSFLCAVEIKSKLAHQTETWATTIANQHGKVFYAVAGESEAWFRATGSTTYRAQIIHQATVLDVEHVLFVVGTKTTIKFCMCVWVPKEARASWLGAIRRYDELFTWAYESVDNLSALPPDSQASYEPTLPDELTAGGAGAGDNSNEAKELESVVRSHFPTWAALHLYRMKAAWHIMMPMERLRNAAQVYYNQGKQGCDGVDDNTERLRSRTMTLSWESKRTLAFLHDAFNNACILYRIYKARKSIDVWTSRRTFRVQCNRICTVSGFSGDLCMQLILCSEQVARQIVRIVADTAGSAAAAAAPLSWVPPWQTSARRLSVIPLADQLVNVLQRIVTDKNMHLHDLVTAQQGTCVICGRRAWHQCAHCRVVLHVSRCYTVWHTQRALKTWILHMSPQSENAASVSTSGSTSGSASGSVGGSEDGSEGSKSSILVGPRLRRSLEAAQEEGEDQDEEQEEELL